MGYNPIELVASVQDNQDKRQWLTLNDITHLTL
jgi:hypothetical protein